MGKLRLITILLIAALITGLDCPGSLVQPRVRAAYEGSSIRVRAYPLKAVTAHQDLQTVYVIVQDQNLAPVLGAEVSIRVQMPDGAEQLYIVSQPTGINGIAQTSFPVSANQMGLVIVNVLAARSRMEAKTSTSFRIWW